MTNEQLNQYYSKDADKKQCWVSKDHNCPLKEQCNGLVFIGINKRHARQNLQLLVDNGTEIAFAYSVRGKADVDRLGIKYTVQ